MLASKINGVALKSLPPLTKSALNGATKSLLKQSKLPYPQ